MSIKLTQAHGLYLECSQLQALKVQTSNRIEYYNQSSRKCFDSLRLCLRTKIVLVNLITAFFLLIERK